MKMSAIIAVLISLGVSFGGGYYVGTSRQKAKTDLLVEQSKIEIDKISLRLDSLKNVPAKVDTVIIFQTKIVEKTDTLILINKDIYQNTDTIKNELRDYVHKKNR